MKKIISAWIFLSGGLLYSSSGMACASGLKSKLTQKQRHALAQLNAQIVASRAKEKHRGIASKPEK